MGVRANTSTSFTEAEACQLNNLCRVDEQSYPANAIVRSPCVIEGMQLLKSSCVPIKFQMADCKDNAQISSLCSGILSFVGRDSLGILLYCFLILFRLKMFVIK